jgi:hypothetical protein
MKQGFSNPELFLTNIEHFKKIETLEEAPSDSDVRDLLVWGDIKPRQLASEILRGSDDYILKRDCVELAAEAVGNSKSVNIILQARAGNGKSVCLNAIGYKLNQGANEVFKIENNTKKMFEELPQLRSLSGKKVFLIEDVFSHFEAIRAIQSFNFPEVAIICTARSSVYDLRENEARQLFRDDILEFDLDRLSDTEQKNLVAYFDKYGFWRDLQSVSAEQKAYFISQKCSFELRAVLLHFLDSQPIRSKISQIYKSEKGISDSDKSRLLVTAAQLLNLAGYDPKFELLSNLLEFDTFAAANRASTEFRDFTRIRNGKLALRSPILSEYIIKNIVDVDFLMDCMVSIMDRLDVLYDTDFIYSELMKTLVRFSFLEGHLPTNDRRGFLIRYYESMKLLVHFQREPLFWLQYAIARLSLREFDEAKQMFDVAYSFAKARGYSENRHLDNQFARYWLESRTFSEKYSDFMEAFNRAHQILTKQMLNEPLSYNPYRIAQHYYDFAVRRRDVLSTGDRMVIVQACLDVLRRISRAQQRLKTYRVVIDAERHLKETVKVLN